MGQPSSPKVIESPQELAARINLPINNWMLLSRALTHRSYLNEQKDALEDNERLEFLGDAVMDFIVGAWLYNRYPEMAEGELTRMRSALVHTQRFAEFARILNLGAAMRLGRGESQGGGRNRDALLCDTFEAVIGALYLDCGIDAVKEFTAGLLETASEDVLLHHKNEDPKSLFQEWAQSQGFQAPIYVTRNASGPDHSKIFEVDAVVDGKIYGSGIGHSKQMAAKMAAARALEQIGYAMENQTNEG